MCYFEFKSLFHYLKCSKRKVAKEREDQGNYFNICSGAKRKGAKERSRGSRKVIFVVVGSKKRSGSRKVIFVVVV
jgi:hypothetical protein